MLLAVVRRVEEPSSEPELLERARSLAGLTLGELASRHALQAPPDLRRAKGFVGQLLERALGASAGSRAHPDFQGLGVELKSLPVDRRGKPVESTFVCSIPLTEIGQVEWGESRVWRKLRRVLWVPVEGEREIAVPLRRVGQALLWSPDEADEVDLRFDWEELAGLIGRGDVESITGHLGRVLQVRPKAAHGRVRRVGHDREGTAFAALPRGFYLRATFTARILEKHYALPR